MKNSNELVFKLTRDINRLQNKIDHKNLYNVRNAVVRILLKSGILIDYALPYFLSSMIVSSCFSSETPFRKDFVTQNANIKTIDTSTGRHIEYVSYDFDYSDQLIEHSTGWILNDDGFYERTVTSYRLNSDIDLADTETIMAMTKEELEQIIDISDIKTIKKKSLTPEDMMYDSDAIIVVNSFESDEIFCTRLETDAEDIISTIGYILQTFILGVSLKAVEEIMIKIRIKGKLMEFSTFFRKINDDELNTIKGILQLKKENLKLLSDECDDLGEEHGNAIKGILQLRKENLKLLSDECDDLGEEHGRTYILRRK